MQNLNRDGFSAAAVQAGLEVPQGSDQVDFEYRLLDSQNRYMRTLTNVLMEGNSITQNAEAEIKRTAKFRLVDDGLINFLSDRIQPWVKIWIPPAPILRQYAFLYPAQVLEELIKGTPPDGGWAQFPQGVFLLSSPEAVADASGAIIREVEAYDQNKVLLDDKIDGRYLVVKGTIIVPAIRTLLESAGITRHNITDSDKQMPADREWDPGTPKLTVINEMLKMLNYESLWVDEYGVPVGAPYVLPEQAPSEYLYQEGARSVIEMGSPKLREDLFSVSNKWVLTTPQRSDRAVLKSIRTNSNPSSPLSTVSRGRTIVEYRQAEAADQATLDSLAQRLETEASQIYQHISWSSWVMPQHSHFDNYTLKYKALNFSAKVREVGWTMELQAEGRMTHDCRLTMRA